MRVLLGPTNFANQSLLLAEALRARGVRARHLRYAWNAPLPRHRTRRTTKGVDEVIALGHDDWLGVQMRVLEDVVDERPDVVHLWNRSLVHPPRGYGLFAGFDVPYLRASGIRVVHRFTGYDLRSATLDRSVNPFSPLHRGYRMASPEEEQRRYIDHLRQWVDVFVVQDPEMRTFFPQAEMIPRAVDLGELAYVGPVRRKRPLVVHAPSHEALKGTSEIQKAVAVLQARGVAFDFEIVKGLAHADSLERCRRADIIVDQVLIGWYGVLGVEAMALGKPVLAYLRPGLADQLDEPPPIVSSTPERLAEALEPLIVDHAERERLGIAGRRFAERVHDSQLIASATQRLYERVLEMPGVTDPAPRYLAACAQHPRQGLTWTLRYNRMRATAARLWRRRRAKGGVSL